MLRIDFYLIGEKNFNERLIFICRLIEKAYKRNHRIFIQARHEKEAHALDELLWTYQDDSFLPHNLLGEGPNQPPPIQIGWNEKPISHHDILINLNPEIPSFYSQFKRILEIVSSEPTIQNEGREHYRFYRSQGHDIKTHHLETV